MTTTDAVILLDAIKNSKVRLTDFERDFCRSIVRRCAVGNTITKGQADVLNKIYGRCYGGGVYARKQYIA